MLHCSGVSFSPKPNILSNGILSSVAEAVFSSKLKGEIFNVAADLTPEMKAAVLSNVKVAFLLPDAQKSAVLNAYTVAINNVFIIGIPASALASFAAILIPRGKIASSETFRGTVV